MKFFKRTTEHHKKLSSKYINNLSIKCLDNPTLLELTSPFLLLIKNCLPQGFGFGVRLDTQSWQGGSGTVPMTCFQVTSCSSFLICKLTSLNAKPPPLWSKEPTKVVSISSNCLREFGTPKPS